MSGIRSPFVVAKTPVAARDAAEAIHVAYEELPAVPDVGSAGAPTAPQLWPQAPGNIAFRFEKGDRAAVATAFASAFAIVELDLENNRVIASAMEPRAAIGRYDTVSETFDLTLSGQGVHEMREQLARDVLRIPTERVHLMAPDVGGGFGPKNVLHPEYALLLVAARRLGRPVRWTAERTEDFLSTVHSREQRTRARLALDANGRFIGLDVSTDANMGAYLSAGAAPRADHDGRLVHPGRLRDPGRVPPGAGYLY
jgi:carbon-monoxide dehydrogenase large subunit